MLPYNRSSKARFNKHTFGVLGVSIIVAGHGILILAATLLEQVAFRHPGHLTNLTVDIPIFVGLSIIYLSVYLRRKKRTAWAVTIFAYAFYLGVNIENLLQLTMHHELRLLIVVRILLLPLAIVSLLLLTRNEFVVHSDTQGFRVAARFSLIILAVAFLYGVSGFSLLDKSDFHQEISLGSAIHHTLDQFDLTTSAPLHPFTKRAHLFVDSLSVVSIGALIYALISLFQPLRARFTDQTELRTHMHDLLRTQHAQSEDYFKLWPEDKQYFFDETGTAGLALKVHNGVALCLGDPVGPPQLLRGLLTKFHETCFSNDWVPAHIHVENTNAALYEEFGYSLQKIGQEAVLDIKHFDDTVRGNKYFRHINNKFVKQSYTTELLLPPHHDALIHRLSVISNEWLGLPGRVERGFAMGYFSPLYMQMCPIMVVRDAAGTIQAFLNQVPADFDTQEATYDLLRHAANSLSNMNDFLLMRFIEEAAHTGYRTVNLGLCPLAGFDDMESSERTFLNNILRFAYANGDRIYSFSGLYKFKAKYEPEWRDRFIAHQGGVRGFSRTMTELTRVMKTKKTSS